MPYKTGASIKSHCIMKKYVGEVEAEALPYYQYASLTHDMIGNARYTSPKASCTPLKGCLKTTR